jgi:hypothetical protein
MQSWALWLAIFNSAIRLAPFGADLEVVRSHGLVTSKSIPTRRRGIDDYGTARSEP